MVYHNLHLYFLIILGLECLSAHSGDLFDDHESVMADASIFNSPDDASVPALNGVDGSLLLATSPDNSLNVQPLGAGGESIVGGYEASDPNIPSDALSSPTLLALDDDTTKNSAPSQFHDTPPGDGNAPECWFPKLAVCCDGRYNKWKCVWFDWDIKICENDENIRCCEQVLPSGEARDCEFDVKTWPGVIWGAIIDVLRTPVELPAIPAGGFWSPVGE